MSDRGRIAETLSSSMGSNHNAISQPQRVQAASVSDQPVVPRILSSARTTRSQDSLTTNYDSLASNEFTSTLASSSSPSNESPEAPDPAIIDALKNAKERLFVLKLGENMETLIDQRRYVFFSWPR